MELGARLDMVILKRIFAPSKGPKWAQQGEKLTIEKPNKKKNENEKSSKLRVFFFCRFHCQRIDIDVRLLVQMF